MDKYYYTAVITKVNGIPTLTMPDIPVIKIAGADTVTMVLEAEERLKKYIIKRLKMKKALPSRNTMVIDYIGKEGEEAYDIIVYIPKINEEVKTNEKVN